MTSVEEKIGVVKSRFAGGKLLGYPLEQLSVGCEFLC